MLTEYERTIKRIDMINCVLCHDAPCSSACPYAADPGKKLRSIWFNNEKGAAANLFECSHCLNCDAPCERACVRPGKVPIQKLISQLYDDFSRGPETVQAADEERLRTDICGIPIENPFLLSSSVVASTYDMCARGFEAGWPVFPSRPFVILKFTRPLPDIRL